MAFSRELFRLASSGCKATGIAARYSSRPADVYSTEVELQPTSVWQLHT